MITTLDVMIWDMKAGTLAAQKKGYETQVCFYFDPGFIKAGYDIAPLRASIYSDSVRNGFPVFPESDRLLGGLPSFIADSLPDHWGNLVFKEWSRQHGIKSKDINVLDRLAYIGHRGMGALEFIPPTSETLEVPFKVEITQLAELADLALEEAKRFHADLSTDFMIESLFKVGTSAGGRRPKAVINLNTDSGECYSGQVATPYPGFTPMIIKFDERSVIPTTRIEYSYYLMAKEAGLRMMPCRLMEAGGYCHFLTERFDRRGDEKIHTQTLAAINPLADSYDDLFEAASMLKISPDDMHQLYKLMVMNVACGNIDDHNKNFSFTMGKDAIWHVAPAYDFTFAVDPDAPGYVNRHSMTVNGKTDCITRSDLLALAKRHSIKNAPAMIARAISSARNYRKHGNEAEVAEKWIYSIEREIGERIELLKK